MKKLTIFLVLMGLLTVAMPAGAQQTNIKDSTEVVSADSTTVVADSAMAAIEAELTGADAEAAEEGGGLHKQLKRKFLEGSAGFMSLVALALVLGLAFCIERLVYLTWSRAMWKVPRTCAVTREVLWPASAIRGCCTSRSRWSR